MSEGPRVALVVASFLVALIGLVSILDIDRSPQNPTFTCGADEVGVWANYEEREMDCVKATDHDAHQGDHDG